MAEMSAAQINDLPDSAFACIEPGGKKDAEGKTVPRSLRHYPHHDANGAIDLAHLRNAMARIHQDGAIQCGMGHLQDHADAAGMGKMRPVKATILDEDRFSLLAIPFGGPIPSPIWRRGVDLDGETFTEQTDIKSSWFDVRIVDWHHGQDPVMRRTVIGKAENLRQEEDGWWVDVWLRHGEDRLELIRRLAERGATLFGSSESLPGMVKKADDGEILIWPYVRQTLSTSPQNTYSVLRPMKAILDGLQPTGTFWSEIEVELRDLGVNLRTPPRGASDAKAGRVLSALNEQSIREALARLDASLEELRGVLSRQPDYSVLGQDGAGKG